MIEETSKYSLDNLIKIEHLYSELDPNRTITDLSSIIVGESDEKYYKYGRWTKDEHNKFIKGLILFGNNWKKIQHYLITRSISQARSHAQKYFMRIKNT